MKQATFLAAFLLFLALNVAVLPLSNVSGDRYNYSYRSWPWWLVHHLRTTTDSFNVALLGSSLLLSSINECDANYSGKSIDATAHHQSLYLDNKLSTAFDGNFHTFNLATPGQMPSDAYFLTKAMLQLGQHPKLVIYGIAPRDFLDSKLASPASTEPFKYLRRFVSSSEVALDVFGLELAAIDNVLSSCLFLRQHAVDMQIAFSRQLDAGLQALLPAPQTSTPFTYWDRVGLLSEYKAGEVYPGASVNAPTAWQPNMPWKRDNVTDYLERYRKPNADSFKLQLKFLNRLISLCQDEKMELVLVNMPLSHLNISILGAKRYAEFVNQIKTICLARNVKLFDLGLNAPFGDEYFEDSAHLNGFGGKRFLDLLTEKMKADADLLHLLTDAKLASRHSGTSAE